MRPLIRLTLKFDAAGSTLHVDALQPGNVVRPLLTPIPAIGVTGTEPMHEDVWLVGRTAMQLGGDADPAWKRIVLLSSSLGPLMTSFPTSPPSDEALVAAGLVLTAFAELGDSIGQLAELDVAFVCRGWVRDPDKTPAPPPWLVYALRRLGLRGRVAALSDWDWDANAVVGEDGNIRHERLFPGRAGENGWCELLEVGCPIDVIRTESFKVSGVERTSQTWKAIVAGASLPLNTGHVLTLRDGADLVIVDWFLLDFSSPAPAIEEIGEVESRRLGPWATEPRSCLLIRVRSLDGPFDESRHLDPSALGSVHLDEALLSRVNPFDGISQSIEIDRYGRMLLMHMDDADRTLPVWTCDGKAVMAVDLGNLLFHGLAFDYPTHLARCSYNGGPIQLAPPDRQVEIRSLERRMLATLATVDGGRAIKNRYSHYRNAIEAVRQAPDVDAALAAISWDLRHLAKLKMDLNTAKAEMERDRPLLERLTLRSERGDWAQRRDTILQDHEARLQTLGEAQIEAVLKFVPPEMPEVKAAIRSIDTRAEGLQGGNAGI